MGKNNQKWLLFLLVSLLTCSARAEQGTPDEKMGCVLHGYVTDAITKKPLSGVTVSAIVPGTTTPAAVRTNAEGYYRFVMAPSSRITVQFDKKGYQPARRPNITVKEKATVKLNVEFLPEEMGSESDDTNAEYPMLRMLQAS